MLMATRLWGLELRQVFWFIDSILFPLTLNMVKKATTHNTDSLTLRLRVARCSVGVGVGLIATLSGRAVGGFAYFAY